MKEYEATPEEVVLSTLLDADNSGMDIKDCWKLLVNAHCIGCWSEAVALYGMEGIDTTRARFVYSGTAKEFFNRNTPD